MLTLSTVNNETHDNSHVDGYGSTAVLWRDGSDHR
jgi:hypothetical protein